VGITPTIHLLPVLRLQNEMVHLTWPAERKNVASPHIRGSKALLLLNNVYIAHSVCTLILSSYLALFSML
jgi:hypothetical protein